MTVACVDDDVNVVEVPPTVFIVFLDTHAEVEAVWGWKLSPVLC